MIPAGGFDNKDPWIHFTEDTNHKICSVNDISRQKTCFMQIVN